MVFTELIPHRLFTRPYRASTDIFFKGWYFILLLKMMFLGSLYSDLYEFSTGDHFLPRWMLQSDGLNFVKPLLYLVIISGLCLKRNYLLSLIIFVVYGCYHQIIHPVVNGSDLILLFFLFLSIFSNVRPKAKSGTLEWLQLAKANFCILIGQLHVVFIYFTSGWDKLHSVDWRTGDALLNLSSIDFYAIPVVSHCLSNSPLELLWFVSWMVIIFELAFPVLVWWPKSRYSILGIGIIFHLIIGIGFSLPDFAITMIWCYIIFLSDQDIRKARKLLLAIPNQMRKQLSIQ